MNFTLFNCLKRDCENLSILFFKISKIVFFKPILGVAHPKDTVQLEVLLAYVLCL